DGIQGSLTLEAGGGDFNRLVVSAAGGAADPNIVLAVNQITGLAPAPIIFQATGGHFNAPSGAGVTIRGSNGADTFTVTGTLAGNSTRLEGLGGADTFANDGALVNNGNLDVLAGPLTILGGDPGPLGSIDCDAEPIGT